MRCSHCYGCMCIFIYVIISIQFFLYVSFKQMKFYRRIEETKYWKKRKTRGKTRVCVRKIICSSNIWGLVIQMVYTFTIVARSFCRCNFPFITFTFSSFSHLIYICDNCTVHVCCTIVLFDMCKYTYIFRFYVSCRKISSWKHSNTKWSRHIQK